MAQSEKQNKKDGKAQALGSFINKQRTFIHIFNQATQVMELWSQFEFKHAHPSMNYP